MWGGKKGRLSTSNNAKAYSSGTHFRAVAYINPLGGSYVLERRLSDVVAVGTHTNRFLSKWLERVLREGCSIQVCFVSFLTGVPDQEIRQQPARWGRTVYLPDRRAPRLHSPRLSALRTASRPASTPSPQPAAQRAQDGVQTGGARNDN